MSRAPFLGIESQSLAIAALVGVLSLTPALFSQTTAADLPADCSAYDSVPLPAESSKVAVPKESPACASYRSYRGIGRPVNYAEARACAWQERAAQQAKLRQNPKEPTAWVVGGSLILADIYFNGAGVKRDIPLAMRFACEFEDSAAMLAMRYNFEAQLEIKSHAAKPFEFCDYAVTTFAMNFCGGYTSEIEDDRRNRYYNSVKATLPADQKAAFEKLLAAKDIYIRTHDDEVDQGGTIRSIRTMGSMSILEDLFRTDVVHFERKQFPALTPAQIASADELLQREFEKKLKDLRKQTEQDIGEGAVTADSLTKVEKSWETYRDMLVAFARLRYPAAAEQIRAKVTLDRYRLLKTIYSYSDPPR